MTPFVHLRIAQSLLVPSTAQSHLYAISQKLSDILLYASESTANGADWLLKIANILFDPANRSGTLYTHSTHDVDYWYGRDITPQWVRVPKGAPLEAKIYEYSVAAPVRPSCISKRSMASVTSANAAASGAPGTFRSDLERRDQVCVISGAIRSLRASHLIPRRMGETQTREVVEMFAGGEAAAAGVHRFHPSVGVLLIVTHDEFVGKHDVGFLYIDGNSYVVHCFQEDGQNLDYLGNDFNTMITPAAVPRLHGLHITLSAHAPDVPLPLPGVFDWHYMQCVIKWLCTDEYKSLDDINYLHVPFKTEDDDLDEWTFDSDDGDYVDGELPYPGYQIDRFRMRQARRRKRLLGGTRWYCIGKPRLSIIPSCEKHRHRSCSTNSPTYQRYTGHPGPTGACLRRPYKFPFIGVFSHYGTSFSCSQMQWMKL